MLRSVAKLSGLSLMLVAASVGVVYYQHTYSTTRQIEKLQDEKKQLEQVVTRLTTERRVADLLVSRQDPNSRGQLETTLLFVEYDKQDNPLPAKSFTFEGDKAHIDALVIRFEHGYIAADDPLRGHSIALFTRIYGEDQTPAQGAMIDTPGQIPQIYRDADPRVSTFELDLWKDFWKLYDDASYRAAKGVRIEGGAAGQSVWGPFKPDRLYTITLESAGGLTMTNSPLKGIYREALKQRFGATTQPTTLQ